MSSATQELEALCQELANARAESNSLEEALCLSRPQLKRRLDDINARRQALDNELAMIEAMFMEEEPALADALETSRARADLVLRQVKEKARQLDPALLEDSGISFEKDYEGYHALKVTISKAAVETVIDVPGLLRALPPTLREIELDGDPLVIPSIDPAILERLVASGRINQELVDAHTTKVMVRSPRVRITEKE